MRRKSKRFIKIWVSHDIAKIGAEIIYRDIHVYKVRAILKTSYTESDIICKVLLEYVEPVMDDIIYRIERLERDMQDRMMDKGLVLNTPLSSDKVGPNIIKGGIGSD